LDLDRLGEHLLGAHPQAVVAVLLPVDDHLFQRLAVLGRAEDGVLVALEVPVAPWRHRGHGLTPSNRFHSCITHSSCSGSATASSVFWPVGWASWKGVRRAECRKISSLPAILQKPRS